MTNFFAVDADVDPIELVRKGNKSWRLVATLDEAGCLSGEFLIRSPDRSIVQGHLARYREFRAAFPRDVYLALRQLKNTFQAEQAGMWGHA